MLVYGSKHSSKTYTMFGEWPNINNTQTQGVAPRVFQDCFRRARASKDNVTTVIKMQMIEIYYLKGVEKIRVINIYIYIYIGFIKPRCENNTTRIYISRINY